MPNEALLDLAEYAFEKMQGAILSHDIVHDQLVMLVKPENITQVLQFLRDDREMAFKMLLDVTAVDYPERDERFEVVYHLLSVSQNHRVRVKAALKDNQSIDSAVSVFSSANWLEREVWDMFGIYFNDHPDLRRILTDYGFNGHPLRKDFPLTGYTEMRYDEELKRVIYEPVKLTQDFRRFDFLSPWEGVSDIQELPGDEKATRPAFGWTEYNTRKKASCNE
jgi:NADH-quinone oxidoreductase subunit C